MNTATAQKKCPRCGSIDPGLHPAVQFEGEVSLCAHRYHDPARQEIWVCPVADCARWTRVITYRNCPDHDKRFKRIHGSVSDISWLIKVHEDHEPSLDDPDLGPTASPFCQECGREAKVVVDGNSFCLVCAGLD